MTVVTLPNRVPFVYDHIPESRVCALSVRFAVGSRHEGAAQQGITHFVEHLLFKGTASRSAFAIAASFDRMGGYLNAYTERDCVVVYCVIPGARALEAAEILVDMAQSSLLTDDDIAKEREVIIAEIIAAQDDPEDAANDAAMAAVYPNHPLSAPIAGTPDSVRALTNDALRAWYHAHVASGPCAIYAAGRADYGALGEIFAKLRPRAQTGDRGGRPDESPPLFAPRSLSFIPAPHQQTQVFLMTPLGVPLTEERYLGWAILNALIGDTMSSRLFQSLRERSGLCYTVYSYATFYEDCGLWCAYASAEQKNAAALVGELLATLGAVDLRDDEIAAAQEHLCGEGIVAAEDVESRMKRLTVLHREHFPHTTVDGVCDALRAFTRERLQAPLELLLNLKDAALVIYGPALRGGAKKKIQEMWEKCRYIREGT
jgi:predicted Zn-dependent peptidase